MDATTLTIYRVLNDAHHAIDEATSLDGALKNVIHVLVEGLSLSSGVLWLKDSSEAGDVLRPTFWEGTHDYTGETHVAGDGSMVSAAFASQRAVGEEDDGIPVLAIPIASDVASLGVVEITCGADKADFTDEERDVVDMCVMLATLAHERDARPQDLWKPGELVIRTRDVCREFKSGETVVHVLNGVSLDIFRGEFLVLLGESGCGKSTLLNIIGGLDEPTSGSVAFEGTELANMDDRELTTYRREQTGFVFQSYNLMPHLTARQNVSLFGEFVADPVDADEALAMVGLSERADNKPSQLSGGQQQRISIARALAKRPHVIFADEPTAALDYETSIEVLETFERVRDSGCTLVMVTHNEEICKMANRVVRLRQGRLSQVTINPAPAAARELVW